jgi:hypothetical protein
MDTEETFAELSDKLDLFNKPRDTFVQCISGYSLQCLVKWKGELLDNAKSKEEFPTDRLLKRRRGQQLQSRLAEDCYMLHSFVQDTFSIGEISELFSSSLNRNQSQSSQSLVCSPNVHTPRRKLDTSFTASPTSDTAISASAALSLTAGKDNTMNIVLIDTLASIQAQLHANREDIQSLKNFRNNDNTDKVENEETFTKTVESLQLGISDLTKKIDRRSNKVTELEHQITLHVAENKSLKNQLVDLSKEMVNVNSKLKSCEGNYATLKAARSRDIDVMNKSTEDIRKNFKDAKHCTKEISDDVKDVKSQLSKIKDPSDRGNSALKSEQKRIKTQLSNMDTDLYSMEKAIDDVKHLCDKITKVQHSTKKSTDKLKHKCYDISNQVEHINQSLPNTKGQDDHEVIVEEQQFTSTVQAEQDEWPPLPPPGQASMTNLSHTAKDRQFTENQHDDPIPTHVGSRQPHQRGVVLKTEQYYLGNLNDKVTRNKVFDYLAARNIRTKYAKLMPSRVQDSYCAKVIVLGGHGYDILAESFWPKGIYARIWYDSE